MHDRSASSSASPGSSQPDGELRRSRKAHVEWQDPNALIRTGPSHSQFTLLRTGRRFLTRSAQERKLMLVVDLLVDVLDVRIRPAVVTFRDRGVERSIEPILWMKRELREDFWIDRDTTNMSQLSGEALASQLLPLKLGMQLVSVAELTEPSRLEIARSVRRHARHPVDATSREHARRMFGSGNPVLWQDVSRGKHPALSAATTCRLVFDGVLRLSPPGRLRADTRVELIEP